MTELAQLLADQIPKLRRYARALTRNPDVADDLVQDTLVRAVAKQALWQEGTNLRAWLFTLMHNQHVDDVRRNVRTGQEVDIDSDGARSLRATTDPSGSRQLMELERALGQLPMEQRQVMLLIGMKACPMRTPPPSAPCRSAPSAPDCRGAASPAPAARYGRGGLGGGDRRRVPR